MAERCRKSFQYFLEEWRDEGDHPKYLEPARELLKPERDTLQVSLTDIETYNSNLVEAIIKNFYRLHPHLCVAVKNFVVDLNRIYTLQCYFVATLFLHKFF